MNELKLALLGKGKTGQYVLELLDKKNVTIFDSKNLPTIESLKGHNAIISFLPGDVFIEYIPMLKASKIPVITGSTGFEWPKNLNSSLRDLGVKWIFSNNFALGMNLVRILIEKLASAENLFQDVDYKIIETHHINKKDKPSGTAKSWDKWLSSNLKEKKVKSIESIRKDDVVGIHTLELDTKFEKITLTHEAKDRSIFAEGALWAVKKVLTDKDIPYGLNSFSDITLKEILK